MINDDKIHVPWNKGVKGSVKPNSGSFKQGHVPWNKGIKGSVKPNSGSFKKGNRPKNYKPVGSERIVDGFRVIKVKDPNVWTHKGRCVWQQHHGPIPKDHVVVRLDGDKLNDNIDNLRLVHKSVLPVLNKKFSHILKDKDLMNTCINLSELLIELNKKVKKKKPSR